MLKIDPPVQDIWRYFLQRCYELAFKSPDPSTQVGAIIVGKSYHVLASGFNRFPRGVKQTAERLERPLKYLTMIHAESYCICQAAKDGFRTHGQTMVASWASCSHCAKSIIQSGIVRLVRHKQASDRSSPNWLEEIKIADQMFKESGVEVIDFDGKIGCDFDVLHAGQLWRP